MTGFRIPTGPERIVCVTEEPTEILYALGEGHRVVGISAYTVRPPQARREKPVVSAFVGGSVGKIRERQPDLVIGFSDVQADFAQQLIKAHLPVLIFNQRSLQDILNVVVSIANLVGAQSRGQDLVRSYIERLETTRARHAGRRHPRVYFEEWDDPSISAIGWVSELIEIAGGTNVFADRAAAKDARGRQVSIEEIEAAAPEIILASWCGKPFDREAMLKRVARTPAAQNGRVHEMSPEIILQPGPACLTDGLAELQRLIDA